MLSHLRLWLVRLWHSNQFASMTCNCTCKQGSCIIFGSWFRQNRYSASWSNVLSFEDNVIIYFLCFDTPCHLYWTLLLRWNYTPMLLFPTWIKGYDWSSHPIIFPKEKQKEKIFFMAFFLIWIHQTCQNVGISWVVFRMKSWTIFHWMSSWLEIPLVIDPSL